jgi:hypothetical protein
MAFEGSLLGTITSLIQQTKEDFDQIVARIKVTLVEFLLLAERASLAGPDFGKSWFVSDAQSTKTAISRAILPRNIERLLTSIFGMQSIVIAMWTPRKSSRNWKIGWSRSTHQLPTLSENAKRSC